MDEIDALDAGGTAWWRDPDPESAHAKYLRMHSSDTNRSKNAVTERMLAAHDWRGRSVLEYGCGGGYFSVWLAQRGATVHALDMNPNAVGAARFYAAKANVADRLNVALGNAEDDEIGGPYDFIFAKDVIEHLDDDRPFLHRLGRQLAAGGHAYIATQNDHSLNYLVEGGYERFWLGNRSWYGWDRTHRRFYNAPMLARLLREVGLEPVRWGSTYLIPWRFVTKRLTGKPRPWRGWASLDRALGTTAPFSRWGWSLAVIARKRR
jgi:2-polyprenyl-6-hydroxyphenyl methylase/3-demethylubiquinone-9 3-methyltransferase